MTESASQTAGPYVHLGLTPNFAGLAGVYAHDLGAIMRRDGHQGQAITLTGRVFDGAGDPLRDAVIEIWQADANGRFAGQAEADPAFTGWGRCACDLTDGRFRFETVRPGPVPLAEGGQMAPHILMWIVARGINLGLTTRVYFEGSHENAEDPVLSQVPAARRETLIARPGAGPLWQFDLRLQGQGETVFFDI